MSNNRHMQVKISAFVLLIVFSLSMCLGMSQQRAKHFAHQVGIDLPGHVAAADLAILPLGAIEFHGPSGPPLADSIIAEGVSARVADELSASVFPVQHYAHCPAHTAVLKGSVSIRPEVVTMLFEDILESLVFNGFKKVLVLNAHNGNIGPAQMAISRVTRKHPETQMLLVSWWETLPTPDVEALELFTSGNGGHGHGGPLELSVTAVFAPDSVRAGMGPDLPAVTGLGPYSHYLEKADTTGWPGYSGKLSEISVERGKPLVDMAVGRIVTMVENWLQNPDRPGSW